MADDAKNGARPKKFMFLRLGQRNFALPLSAVREVLGLSQISTLPNMPAYFAGLINLRGKIVSAVHLKKSLSFIEALDSKEVTKRPCIIITEVSGRLFGAIVDDVVEVQAVTESQIDHTVDDLSSKDVFEGVIKREGRDLAPILNLDKALKVSELIALSTRAAS